MTADRSLRHATHAAAAAAVIALAAACESVRDAGVTTTSVHTILDGTSTAGDPAVMALVHRGVAFCSATLIAPRVVLTAAHCVRDLDPAAVVFMGSDVASGGGLSLAIREVFVHPDFDPQGLQHDLAMLLLDAPVSLAPPARLCARPFDPSLIGRAVRIVGFGTTTLDSSAAGRKQQGTMKIAGYSEHELALIGDPSHTCSGDSGGPAFLDLDGEECLVGVTSSGNTTCDRDATDTRVDAYAAAFIQPYLDMMKEGSAAPGARCRYAGHCATGDCVFPSDAPSIGYCADRCATTADCSPDMICELELEPELDNGSCRYPAPSPGALGSTCAADTDCDSRQCSHRATDPDEDLCSVTCFPNGLACPAGFTCEALADEPDRYGCFPPAAQASGCRAGAGGGDGLAGVLMMTALARVLRRRRILGLAAQDQAGDREDLALLDRDPRVA